MEYKKILKQGDKKIVIIPKNSSSQVGDYVKISAMDEIQPKNMNKPLMGGK